MSTHDRPKRNLNVPPWMTRALRHNKEYPIIDKIVMVYVAVVLLFQILFQISPAMTFLASTPLYDMQTYLGLLGGALIILDLFITKKIWQSKYSYLLYAILVLAAFASVRMISYGVKENLFKLCWAAIQFVLIYSCAYRLDRDLLIKYIKTLYWVLLAIWFVACCVSLYQYVYQISYMYVVNPLAMDSSSTRQGFYDNRLFGIFYTLNHAAYISLMFFLIGVIYAVKTRKIVLKIVLIIADLVLLCHLILSGSRSAAVALFACILCMVFLIVRNGITSSGWKKNFIPIFVSIVITTAAVLGFQGMKSGLALVPNLRVQIVNSMQNAQVEEEVSETVSTPLPEVSEEVLERKELKDDSSNGRFSIWADYVALYKEVGLIGLSPGNYMGYILENHPELYIVEYIRQYYPDKYESGIIYHVHSGYVMVYVSAGILGFLSLMVFIVLCLICVIRKIFSSKTVTYTFICAFLIVMAGSISAVFDEGLFFQNNLHTTMFWFALGMLVKEAFEQCRSKGNHLR